MSQGIIYLITNKINGHQYVGKSSESLNKIWKKHIQDALTIRPKEPITKAFRRYGIENFNIKVIDECNLNKLEEKECYWIKHYNTYENKQGYNTYSGIKEIVVPIEVKQEAWKKLTDETRGNGKHSGLKIMGINIETGESTTWDSARQAAFDITGKYENNSNIILSAKKGYKVYGYRWKLLENKSKKRPVKGICKLTWNEVQFESVSEAIRNIGGGTRGSPIIRCLKNPYRYTWKGYFWIYV